MQSQLTSQQHSHKTTKAKLTLNLYGTTRGKSNPQQEQSRGHHNPGLRVIIHSYNDAVIKIDAWINRTELKQLLAPLPI